MYVCVSRSQSTEFVTRQHYFVNIPKTMCRCVYHRCRQTHNNWSGKGGTDERSDERTNKAEKGTEKELEKREGGGAGLLFV